MHGVNEVLGARRLSDDVFMPIANPLAALASFWLSDADLCISSPFNTS